MSFVKVSGLFKSYAQVQAVQDFSFAVNTGEIFALVGPDGAGKTSIMRMICNLITVDKGEVFIDGLDALREFGRLKEALGYMPQSFSLYPDLTVEENLTFYAGIFGVTGQRYIEKREVMYRFSNLKPFAKRRAQALSGGMKQKLALSCALMHDPKLLLLDEPTTGVDPLSRRQFWEILLELKQAGVTIIVSTPYMDEVARTDRACFIYNGRKLAEGTPQQLTELFDGQLFYLDVPPSSTLAENIMSIQGVKTRRFGAGLHLAIDREDNIDRFRQQFTQMGIETSSLRSIRPGLEDCFIQLMEK